MDSIYCRFIKKDTEIPRPLLFSPKCSPTKFARESQKESFLMNFALFQMAANGFMKKKTEYLTLKVR
ncbi:hypothetical protein QFZ73_000360 [Peribacillus sp. V2I11]|nr:hypothetical protein [Peribacillus sp. V2I11]